MKSRPFFFFKRIRFFLIAVPVLVAAVLLVDVAGRPVPHRSGRSRLHYGHGLFRLLERGAFRYDPGKGII